MELKSLAEVDLREAIGPINRAVTGHYLPLVRTASVLRERAQAGVLDLKLSRCAFIGRELVGTCLVERVEELAHIDVIGVEPLAQQRGVDRALLESACVAAEAGAVTRITATVPEGDGVLTKLLGAAGFVAQRSVARWLQSGALPPLDLPRSVDEEGPEGAPHWGPLAGPAALAFLAALPQASAAPFGMQPRVLERLLPKLQAFAVLSGDGPQAVALLDKDRHLIAALGGETAALTGLCGVLVARQGAQVVEGLAGGDDAEAALRAVGLTRAAVRTVVARQLG